MFDLINGILLHPLVVHAVVVLLPLATLGTLAIALRPRWRRPYGPFVVAAAVVATVLCPVATQSGEQLERRVGDPVSTSYAIAPTVPNLFLVHILQRLKTTSWTCADETYEIDLSRQNQDDLEKVLTPRI